MALAAVCTLSVTGYAYTRPYNSPFNDCAAGDAQLGIFATLLSSIVLKYDEDDRSSDTMAGILGFLAVAPAVVGIAMVGIEHRRNVKLREARKQRIKDRTTGVEHLRRGSSGLTEVKVEEEAARRARHVGKGGGDLEARGGGGGQGRGRRAAGDAAAA